MVRSLLFSGRTWSFILVYAAIVRASSYFERPPNMDVNSRASRVIESHIPYPVWALILVISASAILVGMSSIRLRNAAVFGHAVIGGCYLTFTTSVVGTAVVYDQPWATAGSLSVMALIHFARCIGIGDEIAKDGGQHGE